MADYITLGSRKQTGIADLTGNNAGNWTVTFDPQLLAVSIPYFEIYKMIVHGAWGSTFDVYVDNNLWDTAVRGDLNSWDPNEPLIMIPGQNLYFYYSDAVTDQTPPEVTLWMRYDQSLSANRAATFSR